MKRALAALVLLPLVGVETGCSTAGSNGAPLIPNQEIVVSPGTGGTIQVSSLVGAAIVYMVYDPLAPNWEMEERRLGEFQYQMSLKMKRFNTGGDGDPMVIVRRRAAYLQQTGKYAAYKIVNFDQGIDSQTIGAKRWAEAVIQLVPAQAATPKAEPIPILVNDSPKVTPVVVTKTKAGKKKSSVGTPAKPALTSSQ